MREVFLLATWIAVTAFLGWNTLSLLSGGKKAAPLSVLEKAGLSYALGLGLITVQMFIMSLFGMEYTRDAILIPWIFVVAANLLWIYARRKEALPPGPAPERKQFTFYELLLLFSIALQTLYNFFRALIRPIESYDAVAIYGLKSKMIYLAHGISGGFFKEVSSLFQGAHADYPLLVPLSETWFYTFAGRFADFSVKAIFPLFYISLLLIFYEGVKRATGKRFFALLAVFFLATVKQFSDYATIGVADLVLGAYFGISIFYLYRWFTEKRCVFLNISVISSVLCIWTKNEGAFLALMSGFALLCYAVANFKKINAKDIFRVFIYAALVIAAVFSWHAFTASKGLANENFNLSMINAGSLVSGLGKIPAVLYEYQKQFFGFKKWNIIWILFFFLVITQFRAALSKNIKYVSLCFLLFASGYTFMYVFSAVDIKFFLSATGSRFLLHILPVCVFWMALVADERKLIEEPR